MNKPCPHAKLRLLFLVALNMATKIHSKLIEKNHWECHIKLQEGEKHVKLIKEETSYKEYYINIF
jgi:hypothetical protein